MNSKWIETRRHGCTPASEYSPRIILAYEDYASGFDAVRILTRISLQAGLPQEFGMRNAWKFDILLDPALSEIAARDAAAADMVVIAASGTGALPGTLLRWIEQWLPLRGTSPGAMVAIFGDASAPDSSSQAIESKLEDYARRCGMKFFARRLGTREMMDGFDRPAAHQLADRTSAAFERLMRAGVPGFSHVVREDSRTINQDEELQPTPALEGMAPLNAPEFQRGRL